VFFKWLVIEGEIPANPIEHLPRPKVPVPAVSDEELRKLLNACSGTTFEDRRHLAIGKGGNVRVNRYVRARERHALAASSGFWLGPKGPMTRSDTYQVVGRRGREASIGDVHPHQLRHSFFARWLAGGGQEGDLLALGGWVHARHALPILPNHCESSARRSRPVLAGATACKRPLRNRGSAPGCHDGRPRIRSAWPR
jgi:integrase